MFLEFGSEIFDEILYDRGRSIPERTEGLAEHITRDGQKKVDIALHPLSILDPSQYLSQPSGPFAAGCTFAARFMLEKF